MAPIKKDTIIEVVDFSLSIDHKSILKNINFSIAPNEIVAMVGESGSGKSLTALSLLGLLPKNKTQIDSGTILFEETPLLDLTEKE